MNAKKTLRSAIISGIMLATLLMSSGCFIQSLDPFYTADQATELPDIAGSWTPTLKMGDEVKAVNAEPWLFTKTTIKTIDDGSSGLLKVTYFKVGETTFADIMPSDDADDTNNVYFNLHLLPVHSVCKVELKDDELTMIPLDGDWLIKQLKSKSIALPHKVLSTDEDHVVLTATTKELNKFLKTTATNENAFPPKHVFKFKKQLPQ